MGYIPINIPTNTINDTLKTLINFYEFNKLQCYSDSLIGYKDDNNIEQSIKMKYVLKKDVWEKQTYLTVPPLKKQPIKRWFDYEDENYSINARCVGEWGGSVQFTSKITNKSHVFPATCLNAVSNIDGVYILYISLAHAPFLEILQIKNPDSLYLVPHDSLLNHANWQSTYFYKKEYDFDSLMAVWRKNIDTLAQVYAHFNHILNFEDKTFIFSNRQDDKPKAYIGKFCEGEIHILDTLANAELEDRRHGVQVSDTQSQILTFSKFQVEDPETIPLFILIHEKTIYKYFVQ